MADNQLEVPSVAESVCKDFEKASHLEWLQTNHTGAFAMGTAGGVNTRRYHGLLIATLNPPADRYSIFPRVEETIDYAGNSFQLATVQYPGAVSPSGYELLTEFSSSPIPTWRYRVNDLVVTKSVRLIEGEQSVLISYTASAACKLSVRLFVSFRDYHSLMKQNSSLDGRVNESAGAIAIKPYQGLPAITFYHGAEAFQADANWFNNNEYLRELDRGLDFREDLYSPGLLHYNLQPDQPTHLVGTLESKIPDLTIPPKTFSNPLTQALDQFRVLRADKRPTLIAGYPWFTDWSRDSLISLPALIASSFDPSETKAILEFLLAERKQGVLPNRFSDQQSEPEYNTVDGSLWFFVAAAQYMNHTNDKDFLQQTLFPAAMDIIGWHQRGTFYGIQVDPADHLLFAGQPGIQLTWMDAKIGDYVVTPRIGKPVEINALWFNALQITSDWATTLGRPDAAAQLTGEAALVKASYVEKFWNPSLNCLYDVLAPSGPDASIRPNQMFAISLPYPLFDQTKAKLIIQTVQNELLTPFGVRTLAPSDPSYRPRYSGDPNSRDSAYHQGTAWPWLLGPFIEAYLYAFDNSADAKNECRKFLGSLASLLNDYGLGSIGEVYDAEAPQSPGGCPAQLWSVAQIALATQRLASA